MTQPSVALAGHQSGFRRVPRAGDPEGGACFCFGLGIGWVGLGWGHCGFDTSACPPHAHRMRAACCALSLRMPCRAAHGLWKAQSWTLYEPSSPSRKRTSRRAATNAPGSPVQSDASSISSPVMPARSPSGWFPAVHRNRQTSDHPPEGPSLRISLRVFGCAGRPVAMRASAVIGPALSQPGAPPWCPRMRPLSARARGSSPLAEQHRSRSRAPDQRGLVDPPLTGALDPQREIRCQRALALADAANQGRGYAEQAGGLVNPAHIGNELCDYLLRCHGLRTVAAHFRGVNGVPCCAAKCIGVDRLAVIA